ncbi:HNH endonuclease [Motilibacter deserti]|uniref:HNH endonuclease n=1 Tax=Motilibacter deserti TaxID=2714956 RepID=A0ABX0GTK8_9ACTN|nr:HNH endonuclease [Motilibacter deserti]NHC12663.1 HNH endonuclease [Motilibacter deserti]
MAGHPLPAPGSSELRELLARDEARLLYKSLHRRECSTGRLSRAQLDLWHRNAVDGQPPLENLLEDLERVFRLEWRGDPQASESTVALVGWAQRPRTTQTDALDVQPISLRVRAQVLESKRCSQCGRTPDDHGVVLSVERMLPISWGGSANIENLHALCEECAVGRWQYLETFAAHADAIRVAVTYDEPQRRIGELLRTVHPKWIRSDVLGVVASAKEYQEDWQRRLRDLRFLGWDYEVQKTGQEGVRVWSYYRLTKSAPWPANIPQAIKDEEALRKAKRRG